jgi:hypothetical protein
MDLQETKQLLIIIQKSYPNYFKDFDADVFDFQASVWQRSLSNYTSVQAKMAFETWINTQGKPPQLNEFKELLVKTVNPTALMSSEKAWTIVTDAVRKFGWSNQTKAFETFTEPIKRAIKSVGGWQKICQTELGQQWDFLRKNFMESFDEFNTDTNEQFLLPPDTLRRIQELRQIEEQKKLDKPNEEAE